MRRRYEEDEVPEAVSYTVSCYEKNPETGALELARTREYGDYNDAWANTIGPVMVSKPPVGVEYSVITKREYWNVPSGSRDVPDDCDESIAFVEYYIDDPDAE